MTRHDSDADAPDGGVADVQDGRFTGVHPHVQRAPRLRPDQHLADSMTRVGRFARIDPLAGRDLPGIIPVLGVVGWAALMAESFRRARASRTGGTAR